MDKTLELFYYDSCPFCQKVLRAIDQLGINDKIEFQNIHQSAEADARLVRVGGKHQVPCLFIDGEPMYESGDIVAWLEGEFA